MRRIVLILWLLAALVLPASAQISTLRVTMLTNVSTDETFSAPVNVRGYDKLVIYLSGTGTISSGQLTIQEADYNPQTTQIYTGTWSTIATIDPTGASGGAQVATHLTNASYSFVRLRVNTAIGGGGTVSAVIVGTN